MTKPTRLLIGQSGHWWPLIGHHQSWPQWSLSSCSQPGPDSSDNVLSVTHLSLLSGYSTATKKTLSYTPDLTSGPAHSAGPGCYEYSAYSDNNSNNSLKSSKAAFLQPVTMSAQFSELRPLSEHFYEQPMRVFQPQQTSPAASLGRASDGSAGGQTS